MELDKGSCAASFHLKRPINRRQKDGCRFLADPDLGRFVRWSFGRHSPVHAGQSEQEFVAYQRVKGSAVLASFDRVRITAPDEIDHSDRNPALDQRNDREERGLDDFVP
jgi:hypothetical protein